MSNKRSGVDPGVSDLLCLRSETAWKTSHGLEKCVRQYDVCFLQPVHMPVILHILIRGSKHAHLNVLSLNLTLPPLYPPPPPPPHPPLSTERHAGPGQPPGPAADPPARGDPPAEGGAGVPPPQRNAGRRHVRAGGVRRGVRPAVRHPHEGCLRPVHAAQTPGSHQDEHQLQTLLAVLNLHQL